MLILSGDDIESICMFTQRVIYMRYRRHIPEHEAISKHSDMTVHYM